MININNYSDSLVFENGYYCSSKTEGISYPNDGNANSFLLEKNSFWFQHRNDVISNTIRNTVLAQGVIFDIGGGNGFVSRMIQDNGLIPILVEPGQYGVENALSYGIKNIIRSTFEGADFKDKSIPATGLFDVLEHIEDDENFISSIYRKTTSKGHIFITVPAYNFLWSNEDNFGGHFRRYTTASLSKVMTNGGFKVTFISYFFTFLPIPIFLFRTIPAYLGLRKNFKINKAQEEHSKSKLADFYNYLSRFESSFMRKGNRIPFGASIIAVGLKPAN